MIRREKAGDSPTEALAQKGKGAWLRFIGPRGNVNCPAQEVQPQEVHREVRWFLRTMALRAASSAAAMSGSSAVTGA